MSTNDSNKQNAEKTAHLHYLNEFRVEACPLFKQHQCQQHRPYTCFNWHFANQRRRKPQRKSDGSFNYSPDIYCDKYDENTGICPEGDDCVYLHRVSGDVERKYHLRYYKTAQCVHATDSRGQCQKNGAHCAFAHSSTDLRTPQFDQHETGFSTSIEGDGRDRTSFVIEDPLWHTQDHVLSCYKTEQCRKPARLCRQGYACPFYHNTKDRRRPPAICKYRSTPCPAAKSVDEWLDPELCEAGDSCQYCHTRTEQQFHPEIYKSTKCNDMLEHGYCPRAVFCAFAHHDSELHIQRTPYVTSNQASPKEQCSPNTTNGSSYNLNISDENRFGSPNSNGHSIPTYSRAGIAMPMPKGFSATTDHISSSYPKAPGFERGPLSPNRSNDSSLGRLRTHSLNMGHLDMTRRSMITGGFDPATSLPSHSSLARSDSGFAAPNDFAGFADCNRLSGTLEELSLDLAPIEEHQNSSPRLTDLFGGTGNVSSVTSPMRIPGAESFHTSPLTSFGENLFAPAPKSLLATATQMGAFQSIGDAEKMFVWEEGLKQARQACEAWRADAEHYKSKAEQAELERNRALYERDTLIQQLNAVKIHLANSSLAAINIPSMVNSIPQMGSSPISSSDYGENVIRAAAAMQSSQPFNMFGNEDVIGPACARCGRDRSRQDEQPGCPLCSS